MVRSSFSILFAIRESKARKSGKAPIEITITVNGDRCTLSTGKQVAIDKWDKVKQQVKGKDEEAQSLNNCLKAVIYVEPEELKLVKGTKVRITGGVFEGAVGEFVRLRHDRRVVVNIEGVMAVATTFIHSSLIEPIENI